MASRILVRSSPALPTNGRPVSSSVRPGPSPITTSRAVAEPSPGTVFVRASQSLHFRHAAMSVATSWRLRVCWIGSVAKRSADGGSNEIPDGVASGRSGDSVFGTRETGNGDSVASPAGSPNPRRVAAAVLDIPLPEPARQSKRFFHHVEDSFGHVALGQQRQVDLRTVASQNRHAIGRDLESGAGLSGVIQDHEIQRLILQL